ncbi:MAG: septum site-determining protein MinC [Prochlorococcaceae cyanobacterium]|jgi:septum site-determining protein MinC
MATVFRAAASGQPHRLVIGGADESLEGVSDLVDALGLFPPSGWVEVEVRERSLRVPELREIQRTLEAAGLRILRLVSERDSTLVAAAALGLETGWPPPPQGPEDEAPPLPQAPGGLRIHHGTLRSGEHLQAPGSVLLLGDLNPGARISAAGDVLVWGRLRGVAHAGCQGDGSARIVALQLRPLQLRIAAAVARGPEEQPPAGLAEQARLVEGVIRIEPASPHWPGGRGLAGRISG